MRALTVAPGIAHSARVDGSTAASGVVCLVGVAAPGHDFDVDIGLFNRTAVLDNDTVFGTVNANPSHYEVAGAALARADTAWLERLIMRREPMQQWTRSLQHQRDDIKVIVEFSQLLPRSWPPRSKIMR